MIMKRTFVLLVTGVVLSTSSQIHAQKIDVYAYLDSAVKNMPLSNQEATLNKLLTNNLENLSKAYLPTFNLVAQGSYQSDVPELPFKIPGSDGLNIPNAQYRSYVELSQPLFDGGYSKAYKSMAESQTLVELKSLEVIQREYKKQVATLYFQVLLLKDNREILSKAIDLLKQREGVLKALVENGVGLESDLYKLQSELLKKDGELADLHRAERRTLDVLYIMTDVDVAVGDFVLPKMMAEQPVEKNLSEIQLLMLKKANLGAGEAVLKAHRMPKLQAFGQVGFGNPNPYNFFQNTNSTFYMAGIRASWNIWDWNKSQVEGHSIRLKQQLVDNQKEQKIKEIEIRLHGMNDDGKRLMDQIERDKLNVELRTKIRANAQSQLDGGIITTVQYTEEVLAEEMALRALSINKINYAKNEFMLQFENGVIR